MVEPRGVESEQAERPRFLNSTIERHIALRQFGLFFLLEELLAAMLDDDVERPLESPDMSVDGDRSLHTKCQP